jgi:hypothetical protein
MIQGVLRKNENDRWEFADYELTSGDVVEILIGPHWIKGRMEHSGREYVFLVAEDAATLRLSVGMKARLPER